MFISTEVQRRAAKNAERFPWAREISEQVVARAKPFVEMSDEHLWSLMFGATITRSWMVWSNGHCPSCKRDVPMYNWKIEALDKPWKLACPHCAEIFPKNDFAAFHRSGLDDHGVFDPRRADRGMLFNAEHPDPSDPLHRFGVDDGEGYVDGDMRWRFIGAYLIYGQWKQLVVEGARALAAAHVVTGDPRYAHKAGVILDRVADLYHTFDHATQAWVYETVRTNGFVSTWHDACEETRQLALAYDYVKPALRGDKELAAFLDAKAARYKPLRSKRTPGEVCANIEDGILREAIRQPHKIHSNYPRREIAFAVIHEVLDTPADRVEAGRLVDELVENATRVDGVTGEKGLAGYSAYTIQGMAGFLAQLERMRPGSLKALLDKHPNLRKTYRFHIDTHCLDAYYPAIGDAYWFAARTENYCGVHACHPQSLDPSPFWFLWKLYEATGDEAYVQTLVRLNKGASTDLPHDLFAEDPGDFQRRVDALIASVGRETPLGNIDKRQWCLSILRSGTGENRRAIWLDYDSGGLHAHSDGMNVGLYAKGLDLMPDFGYPPVNFGGWSSPQASWYYLSAAHNTAVIDRREPHHNWAAPVCGRSTLWVDGRTTAAVRASGPEIAFTLPPKHATKLDGAGHDRVGLYFFFEGDCRGFKVFTKPECDSTAGWSLAFEDRFQRGELGPDWKVIDGEFRITDGRLSGHGTIVCTRSFPGNQRIEYEASTEPEPPCDLSAFLAGDETGYKHGAFFGFGSNHNTHNKLVLDGVVVADHEGRAIVPAKRHVIVCERDGKTLRQIADGVEMIRHLNDEAALRVARDSAAAAVQYQRTIVRVDTSDADSYFVDLFRVRGGSEHTKFFHSHFGTLTTLGLDLRDADAQEQYGHKTMLRSFRADPSPSPGWSVTWNVDDQYRHLPPGRQVKVRYTDLTPGASAATCEGWIVKGSYNSLEQSWIPRVMVRRRATNEGLSSTFVSIIEPYEGATLIRSIERIAVGDANGKPCGDHVVGLRVTLADGATDVILASDPETPPATLDGPNPIAMRADSHGVHLVGEFAHVRFTPGGSVASITLGNASALTVGGLRIELAGAVASLELAHEGGKVRVLSGDRAAIKSMTVAGKPVAS